MIFEIEEEAPPTQLLDMPEGPMRRILEKCDLVGIQSLRKSCHSLRNFIDDQNIDPKIATLYVHFEQDSITVTFHSEKFHDDSVELKYEEAETDGSVIHFDKTSKSHEKFIEKLNFVDLFCQDFQLLTINAKNISSVYLFLLCSNFPIKFQKILKSLKLKTERLEFRVDNSSQLLSVLPLFDPKSLKTLLIADARKSDRDLELEKIVELQHWKKLEQADIQCFTVKKPERFKNLKMGSASFMTITNVEMRVLKESFLHMPDFSIMVLRYIYLDMSTTSLKSSGGKDQWKPIHMECPDGYGTLKCPMVKNQCSVWKLTLDL